MLNRILKIFAALIFSNSLILPSMAAILAISTEQCEKMQARQIITNKNPIPCERLRTVNFPIINFTGQTDRGQVVVLDVLAKHTQIIFDTLYHRKFPINKALLMEKYNGDDNASMNDNNTSAFNGRPITGSSDWSLHAYGVAIDINPLQNPYVALDDLGHATILPVLSAKQTINRLNYRPKKRFRSGMAEDAIDIFAENGFIGWGGYWDYPIDYQHFEIGSRKFVHKRVAMLTKNFGRHAPEICSHHATIIRPRPSCVRRALIPNGIHARVSHNDLTA